MSTPAEVLSILRTSFNTGVTKSHKFREEQLKSLLRLYEENESEIVGALSTDLSKPKQESCLTEIIYLKADVKNLIKNLKNWMKPQKPEKSLMNIMDDISIISEPYGVALVIGAWNYPFQVVFSPLAAAIAAGNCVLVKTSELAPKSANLIAQLISKYLNNDCYKVILGGIPETGEILKLQFDHIFFTGSTNVGKIIYQAASKFLTPVILEMGGKSPVYLDDTVDIDIAVRRILWGKLLNAGQSCIAPDYLLCSKKVEKNFLDSAKKIISEWYGLGKIKSSSDFGRIVNMPHFSRLVNILDSSKNKISYGGNFDENELFIEPTIICDADKTDKVMQEEIFGPILPIVTIENVGDAINFVKNGEKPLAFYIFSKNQNTIDLILGEISCGGICVNDTMMHFNVESLPFGGVGPSGIGAYHGKIGFDAFSHQKGVLVKKINKIGETLQSSRYPPYTEEKIKFIENMMNRNVVIPAKYFAFSIAFGAGVVATIASNWICNYFDD